MSALRYTPLLLALALAACEEIPAKPAKSGPEVLLDEHGEPAGLHRHRRWSDRIGQGAQPEGEIAFRNLAALGYTTVLSVDGAVPEVELAERFGLTYVHVPIGYDGVPEAQSLRIVKAVKESKGPVYVHCHHGKHRGPAGAMVARIAVDGISNEEAVEALKWSETSPQYAGLYRDVAEFTCPTDEALAKVGELPSKVLPEGVRAMMVDVSHRWEFLKASREEDWKTPKKHPDISPAHEARMLWERYRELARIDESKQLGDGFLAFLRDGEKLGHDLEDALRRGDHEAADRYYAQSMKTCNACHGNYRN